MPLDFHPSHLTIQMHMNHRPILRIALLGMAFSAATAYAQEPAKWGNDPDGVQVFILAGQSNMVGHGKAEEGHKDEKGAIGSLRYQVVNEKGTAIGQKMVEMPGKQGLPPSAPLAPSVENRFKPLPPGAVELDDKLGQLVDQCIKNRILGLPQGWEQFVVPFEKGDEEGWAAEFWGKWATSVFLAQQYRPTDTNIIDTYKKSLYRIIATQDTDGYIGTAAKDRHFTVWDVWCRKYTMHGLLAYHDLTQDANALSALTRLTDDLMAHVGPGKQLFSEGPHKGMAGATILEPVVLTYLKTGQAKYLDYADLLKDFVLPTIKQQAATHLSGHAYVHMSLCEGLLELYRATGNHDYLNAVLEYYKTTLEQEILTVGSGSNAESWWGFRNGKTAVVAQDEPDFGFFKIETCATVTWIKLKAAR